MNNDVDVIPRDALDPEFQLLHPKPWLVQYPNGYVVHHDTEESACEHQTAHRQAMELTANTKPAAWLVDVAEHQAQYAVIDANDAQLLDDCTNHGATVTPLYAGARAAQKKSP